jgi:hypothetical protein
MLTTVLFYRYYFSEETSGCFGQKKKKAMVKDGKAFSSNGANTTFVYCVYS